MIINRAAKVNEKCSHLPIYQYTNGEHSIQLDFIVQLRLDIHKEVVVAAIRKIDVLEKNKFNMFVSLQT